MLGTKTPLQSYVTSCYKRQVYPVHSRGFIITFWNGCEPTVTAIYVGGGGIMKRKIEVGRKTSDLRETSESPSKVVVPTDVKWFETDAKYLNRCRHVVFRPSDIC